MLLHVINITRPTVNVPTAARNEHTEKLNYRSLTLCLHCVKKPRSDYLYKTKANSI